jgi:hypothetical protein
LRGKPRAIVRLLEIDRRSDASLPRELLVAQCSLDQDAIEAAFHLPKDRHAAKLLDIL